MVAPEDEQPLLPAEQQGDEGKGSKSRDRRDSRDRRRSRSRDRKDRRRSRSRDRRKRCASRSGLQGALLRRHCSTRRLASSRMYSAEPTEHDYHTGKPHTPVWLRGGSGDGGAMTRAFHVACALAGLAPAAKTGAGVLAAATGAAAPAAVTGGAAAPATGAAAPAAAARTAAMGTRGVWGAAAAPSTPPLTSTTPSRPCGPRTRRPTLQRVSQAVALHVDAILATEQHGLLPCLACAARVAVPSPARPCATPLRSRAADAGAAAAGPAAGAAAAGGQRRGGGLQDAAGGVRGQSHGGAGDGCAAATG